MGCLHREDTHSHRPSGDGTAGTEAASVTQEGQSHVVTSSV